VRAFWRHWSARGGEEGYEEEEEEEEEEKSIYLQSIKSNQETVSFQTEGNYIKSYKRSRYKPS
jgi:hypothetical protein